MFLSILLFALAFLPSLTWLIFYLKEDQHPEPPKWLWMAFVIGIGAAPVSFYIEKAAFGIAQWLGYASDTIISSGLFMFLGIALVEELVKFGGAKMLLAKNPVLDEPIDAMIYMITVALGFAAFENVLVLNNYASADFLGKATQAIVLRFIGANFLHTLSSGIIGYWWAFSLAKGISTLKTLIHGIAAATILHGMFNLLIIHLGATYLFATTLLLFVAGLVVLHDFELLKHLRIKPVQLTQRSNAQS
ncbi:MAG: PrsW family intramembrane metalloprotease [Parcubacteria group bacterium]|nr:PrsW family intramembrane metalloprotease [Parcubacteria group bacterium]